MSITFYYGSGSPYGWRVWLALEHKGLAYDLKLMSFSAGDTKAEAFRKLNPRGKVPVLVDGDFALYESVAILEYLEDRYRDRGRGALYPDTPAGRAIARRIIQEADHYLGKSMDAMLREVFYKPAAEHDAEVIATGRTKLSEELALLELSLAGAFLAGPLGAADYTVYPYLALALRGEIKRPDLGIRALIGPRLAAWTQRIEALAYFAKTLPPHWKGK
ncbi:MAG: glutathione S-transferase family protein [Gammaproteobacteria bacterium]